MKIHATFHATRSTILLFFSGWIVLALVVIGAPVALRVIAVFGFSLFAPGTALLRFVPRRDLLARTTYAIALSLTIDTIVTEAFAIAHTFSATNALIALATVTSLLAWVTRHQGKDSLRVIQDGPIRITRRS